jgi:hypothetical protein
MLLHEFADRRAQDEALQAYLEQIGQLLLDKDRPLRQSKEGDEVRMLTRARTLTVLPGLDGHRKRRVLQFLYESGLISRGNLILDLRGADPSGANLSNSKLSNANLGETNLSRADLRETLLHKADLHEADLREADLRGTSLGRADLHLADLRHADLSGSNFSEATPHLSGILEALGHGAILTYTNLEGVRGLTNEQLEQQAKSLEGATMPKGQKYDDWAQESRRGR